MQVCLWLYSKNNNIISYMKVVICAILRTENRYLEEWLDYHLSLGFDHVYLCDNAESGEEIAEEVVENKVQYQDKVTIFHYYNKHGQQTKAYTECYKERNLDFDWMAFIDIDEFISFPDNSEHKTIKEYLSTMKADVILLNWMVYGDNNYLRDDGRGVLERFVKPMPYSYSPFSIFGKAPTNRHVKQILHSGLDVENVCPHVPVLKGNFKVVNADGEPVENQAIQKDYTFKTCYVKHFVTKSLGEYVNTKVKRGRRVDGLPGSYSLEDFFLYNIMTIKNAVQYLNLCREYNQKPVFSSRWWMRNIARSCLYTLFK